MLYGYTLESGEQWPLTNGFDPAVSPDGQTVAFVRDGGEHGLYLIDIDGSDERLIFAGRARLSSPKWSPDGQWLLFTRGDEEYHCIEFGSGCISPPSGPDGREITIPGADTATRYWYKLARVDRNGNNYRDIASLPSARAADWHEAGIVYQSDAGLQLTADVPDAENRLIIFDYLKPFFSDPDWQPQGDRIVYMGKEASHWEIFAVNSDGSGKVALTRPATTVVDVIPSNVAPVWSPDGRHIAFLSNRDVGDEAGAWRVWVMDADGGNQRVLPFELEIDYTFGAEQSISWAP
jgi:Tol biopolymer transport system component